MQKMTANLVRSTLIRDNHSGNIRQIMIFRDGFFK